MKNETKINFENAIRLTPKTLQTLKDKGYLYVQVNSFTYDRRLDYMEPRYFVLVPIKDLSVDPENQGIYEPINSKILIDWSNSSHDDIEVLVTSND